jgi:hypothetical protein
MDRVNDQGAGLVPAANVLCKKFYCVRNSDVKISALKILSQLILQFLKIRDH